ncbi:class I SAM-dependent methyltransferase [Pseudomonas sp. 21LCFQ010]|uniref:class I SAM-dependent methyltransferase n=1 Tax=Pseudomonas sp. 21LCFQ010 TaxID=2957506 RepID=UPI002097A214|nr:class I SAM-dependent methyltransferase [Pseudomonas sp. 21LCFQ010]MCO8163210.1 class I SAM-dependent methyltransferase [Pseudomonas sp. 21LCFQ010]
MSRDLNTEYQDTENRLYAYDFDYIHRDYMIKALKGSLRPGNALEMGCYHGAFTKKLLQVFSDVTVLEGSSDLIEIARQNVANEHVTFILDQFESATLESCFDNIFLIHTLEHLTEPQSVLRKVREWLAPGGRLFIVVPNANAASRQIAVGMGLIDFNAAVTEGERKHGHRCTYSLDTLEHEALRAGFQVMQRGGILFKPMANFQFDAALRAGIIDQAFFDGCFAMGMRYPDLTASVYVVCEA